MTYSALVELTALSSDVDALRDLLQRHGAVSRTCPGCETYFIFQRADDPAVFTLIERWSSADDHDRHFEANVIASGFRDEMLTLVASQPVVHLMNDL